jgi:hypothetical protein
MSRRQLVCTVSYRLSTCMTWHQKLHMRVGYHLIPCTVAGRHSTAVSRQLSRTRDSRWGTKCCTINSKMNWRTLNTSFRFLRRTARLDYGTGVVVLFRFPRTSVCYPMARPVWPDFSGCSTKSSVFRRKEDCLHPVFRGERRRIRTLGKPPLNAVTSRRILSFATNTFTISRRSSVPRQRSHLQRYSTINHTSRR